MDNQHKEFISPVLTLVIIAVISATLLAYIYKITLVPIKESKNKIELEAISEVVNNFNNNPFAEKMIISGKNKKDKFYMYPARFDGVINSVAIKSYTNIGFGGRIELVVGFNADGSINNFKILSSNETPGLGSKVDNPKFKQQFKNFNPNRQILKVRQDGGDIDAVTAATISSRAVLQAIRHAYDAYISFKSGESK